MVAILEPPVISTRKEELLSLLPGHHWSVTDLIVEVICQTVEYRSDLGINVPTCHQLKDLMSCKRSNTWSSCFLNDFLGSCSQPSRLSSSNSQTTFSRPHRTSRQFTTILFKRILTYGNHRHRSSFQHSIVTRSALQPYDCRYSKSD